MEPLSNNEILFDSKLLGNRRRKRSNQFSNSEISINKQVKWTYLLIIAGASTTIGSSLTVGYNIGVINAPADIIKQFCKESIQSRFSVNLKYQQLEFLWSFIVAIFLIGGAVGSLSGSIFADKVGRKGALITSCILGVIASVLFLMARTVNSIEFLIVGRFIIGMSSGLITTVMPMYLIELSPKSIRGSTGVLCPLGVTLGVLLGQIMSLERIFGNSIYWPFLLGFYLIPLSCGGFIICFLPESPKYLYIVKENHKKALEQLARIRHVTLDCLNSDEIDELKIEERENNLNKRNSWNICKVVSDKELLLPLMLVCSLQAGQQFSGINAVFYYSVSIFQKAGLSLEQSQYANIAAGCCNLFMAIMSILIMAKFNRRPILQLSLLTTAFFLGMLGLTIIFITSSKWMPYFSIFCVLGFVVCYGVALGPIPYFVGTELFDVGPRPSAMAVGSMSNWIANFLIGLCFPTMQFYIGAASFFIFAFIVVILYFFIKFYLPETHGQNVRDTTILCNDDFSSKSFELSDF